MTRHTKRQQQEMSNGINLEVKRMTLDLKLLFLKGLAKAKSLKDKQHYRELIREFDKLNKSIKM